MAPTVILKSIICGPTWVKFVGEIDINPVDESRVTKEAGDTSSMIAF